MAYFRNSTVNLLNLHYGLHSFALSGSSAFFGVFLLKSGVPAPMVLLSIAAILLGRLLIRPSVLIFAKRFGVKPLLIAGTVATSLQYPLLAEVDGIGVSLFVLCAISSIGDTLYWTNYHAYFAALGDAEHRGHQVGAREAAAAVAGVIGPLATGWALTTLGPRVAFGSAAAVMLLAALPIVWTPNIAVPQETSGTLKAAMPGMLLFASDAFFAGGYVFVWQIALFLSLGESFSAFGGAMALAAFAGAVGGLLLGRLIARHPCGHCGAGRIGRDHDLASHQRRQCAACGAGECERCAGRLPLCAGAWHRYLQSSQVLAMHAALPHRFGSRLGPRRRQRPVGWRGAVAGRRADRSLHSAVAPRRPGVVLSVADLFFDAQASGLSAATCIAAMRLVAAI
jgi:MFS family permease